MAENRLEKDKMKLFVGNQNFYNTGNTGKTTVVKSNKMDDYRNSGSFQALYAVKEPIKSTPIVNSRKPDVIQALYAVKEPVKSTPIVNSREPDVIQALYGVAVPEPIKSTPIVNSRNTVTKEPVYNVVNTRPVSQSDINITYSQLEENIATLKSSIEKLKTSWISGTKKNIATLNASWLGADCAEYTQKLSKMDGRVQKTISALELLCKAYEDTRDMLKDNQTHILSSIRNLD